MGRPETHIDPTEGPLQCFAYELRTLRRSAGNPSYRKLASQAKYSGTTLSEAARGLSFPSLEVTMAYVSACGGDTAHWKRFWKETDAALHAEETRAEPCTTRPAAPGAELASPAAAPGGASASRRSRSRDALTRFFPAVAGAVGVAGIAGVAGLTGCRPRTATLTVVAGTCMASGFWLGRKLRDA
ncbi:helix-turn-helix domain-containing protein [Streptomyces cyaneogriseus]|uniref:helix-turn-helix domain-containing protein n=1 Tax=Streptomyces cyaneogriseus TaxID=68192 RepID=UPI00069B9175|nr:helix-turn-helix domain-containing protein [Streptomyces cyaneogriseus]